MKNIVDKVNQNVEAGSAQDVFETIHAIMHLYRARQMRSPAAQDAELTHMEGKVLGFFARQPGATLSDLVAHSGRDKAQLTRLIKGLRDKDLLAAEADAVDRRQTRLRPSAAGQALHASWRRVAAEAATLALDGVSEEERVRLLGLLERVRNNLDAADD